MRRGPETDSGLQREGFANLIMHVGGLVRRQLRMKALNILLYKSRLRLMVRREEHHRVVNDSDHAVKRDGLWGSDLTVNLEALVPSAGSRGANHDGWFCSEVWSHAFDLLCHATSGPGVTTLLGLSLPTLRTGIWTPFQQTQTSPLHLSGSSPEIQHNIACG